MKVLFICNQNKNRSKTAEKLFNKKYRAKSAGLYNENPVTKSQISWADLIIVMEGSQRTELSKRFPDEYLKKKIINLDIPDIYKYDQASLIDVLTDKMKDLA